MRGVNHGQMTAISLLGDIQDTALKRSHGTDNKQMRKCKEAPNMVEQQMMTTQQIQLMMKSSLFQDMLAKIVALQVTNLIEPTVKKINQIETQVGELHDYIQDTNKWQCQQTNRQTKLQSDMNTMTTGINMLHEAMQKMMKMQMEQEGIDGMKRQAPALTSLTDPLMSPSRCQRLQQQRSQEQLTTQDSEMSFDYSTSEMAHEPPQIQLPTLPTATAEEQESTEEGGET